MEELAALGGAHRGSLIFLANLKAAAAQQQLAADISDLEWSNARARRINDQAGLVLGKPPGAPSGLEDDEAAWHRWYFGAASDTAGHATGQGRRVPDRAEPSAPTAHQLLCRRDLDPDLERPPPDRGDPRPAIGVLSQDTATGTLAFEPVMVAHHNPPCQTVRLTLENGAVLVPSTYHRFWICGQGWAMARDLKPGDDLRILDGRLKIKSAQRGDVVRVYNLTVAHNQTYFVGQDDCLVHDNTLPGPGSRPFDASGSLEAE